MGKREVFFLTRFRQQLRTAGYPVAVLDAWKCDPEIDPLVSLVAAIKGELDPAYSAQQAAKDALTKMYGAGGRLILHAAKGGLTKIGKKIIGQEALNLIDDQLRKEGWSDDELEELEGDVAASAEEAIGAAMKPVPLTNYFAHQMREVDAQRSAIVQFNLGAEKLVQGSDRAKPFFVFVDELDRCRPPFAIRVLERINHLFDIEGVVFVIGTDSDELEHSIRAVYGSNFNAKSYLRRFFSSVYNLSPPDFSQLIRITLGEYGIDLEKFYNATAEDDFSVLQKIFDHILENARQIKHASAVLQAAQFGWPSRCRIDLVLMASLACLSVRGIEDYWARLAAPTTAQPDEWRAYLGKLQLKNEGPKGSSILTLDQYLATVFRASNHDIQQAYRDLRRGTDHVSRCLAEEARREIEEIAPDSPEIWPRPRWADYESLVRTAAHFERLAD